MKVRVPADTEKEQLNLGQDEVNIIPGEVVPGVKPSLSKAIVGVFLPYFAFGVLFKLISMVLLFVQPQLLK